MNWSKKVQGGAANFERAWEAIAQRTAPVVAAIGMGLLYAWLVAENVGGVYGWVMGAVSAIGLEFGGMLTIQTAVKERGWWIVPAVFYVVTHISTIILIEIFHVESTVAVSVALVVVSVLAYLARGKYVSEEKAEIKRAQDAQAEIQQTTSKALAKAELLKQLNAEGYTLNSKGEVVQKRSKSTPSNTPKGTPVRLSWRSLTPEQKDDVSALSWSVFQSKHGAVPESTFYGWQERIDKEAKVK